jgi:hypothetical protein
LIPVYHLLAPFTLRNERPQAGKHEENTKYVLIVLPPSVSGHSEPKKQSGVTARVVVEG